MMNNVSRCLYPLMFACMLWTSARPAAAARVRTSCLFWRTIWDIPTSVVTAARSRRRISTLAARGAVHAVLQHGPLLADAGGLLTGYYAQQSPSRRATRPSRRRAGAANWARLLPDFLKPRGYRNYHSGKWHIDGPVLAGGFDRSLERRNQGNFFTAKGNFLDDKSRSSPPPTSRATTPRSPRSITRSIACETSAEHVADRRSFTTWRSSPRTFRCTPCRRTSPAIATRTWTAGTAMRKRRFARQKRWDCSTRRSPARSSTWGRRMHFPMRSKARRPARSIGRCRGTN